jgi:hypothetical protein
VADDELRVNQLQDLEGKIMNGMRKVVRFILAMVFVAFAAPSVAAPQYTKLYSLTLTASAPLTVVAALTNQALSPGNSNVGSFRLTFSGATIASVTTNPPLPPQNISVNGSSVFVALGSPLQSQQTLQLTIVLNDCGDGISLPLSGVQVWTGNMGQTFSPDTTTASAFPLKASVVCGDIACGQSKIVPDSFYPGSVTVTRDFYDKDGVSTIGPNLCETVPYTVTNLVTDKLVHLAYPDVSGDPAAAFELKVVWPGGLPAVTKVAWLNENHTSTTVPGIPDFIAALPCNANANFLPTPYGTLTSDVLATDTTIRVNTTIPSGSQGAVAHPGVPFDILVGPEPNAERMTVTVQGGPPGNEIWRVTRGVANVGPATSHPQGALAMSEPLPIMTSTQGIDGQYAAGNQAQMCIKSQEVVTGGHRTTYIAIGDPWGSQP